MDSAYSMAGRIRRSKKARSSKFSREHQAYELIDWGMKFLRAAIEQMPADVPIKLQVLDTDTGQIAELPIRKAAGRRCAYATRNDWRSRDIHIRLTAGPLPTEKKKGRPSLTAIDGGVQS